MTRNHSVPRIRDRVPVGTKYLDRVRARTWEAFLDRIVELMNEARDCIVRGDMEFDYQARKTWWGTGLYPIRGRTVTLPLENSITDALARSCETLRRSLKPSDFMIRKQISIAQQVPRRIQNALGDAAYTTDLQFASLTLHDLDLRIEAKRIFGADDITEYCGEEGLLRFSHDEPYTDRPVGMMLGYSLRHEHPHWNEAIANHRQVQGVYQFGSVRIAGLALPTCLAHSRTVGDVLVVHMLMDFESRPSARAIDADALA